MSRSLRFVCCIVLHTSYDTTYGLLMLRLFIIFRLPVMKF